jgi:O-antigen ligase
MVFAFLAPGAWLVTTLPPIPIARALVLLSAAAWAIAFGLGVAPFAMPDKLVTRALAAVIAVVAISFVLGGSWFQVAFYDLFGNMPLLLWLTFPLVFFLAAGVRWTSENVWRAVGVIAIIGAVLSAVLAFQQITVGVNRVFGTTAYSITALVATLPMGIALALRASGYRRVAWLAVSAVIAFSLGVFSASSMGALAVIFALAASVAAQPALWRAKNGLARAFLRLAIALAAIMVAALLVVQIPVFGASGIVTSAGSIDRNVQGRAQMWEGAQAMFLDMPLFGYGPSGYRVAAAEYLAPEALQYGADAEGNADPTVFSPQSPHALLWEVLTRLGAAGLVAFLVLGFAWARALLGRLKVADGTGGLRTALAAGFAASLFALMVNPVVFPIGLLGAAAAGVAIAPLVTSRRDDTVTATKAWRSAIAAVGIVLMIASVWLGVGEWQAYTAPTQDVVTTVSNYESALAILPQHPLTQRRLLEAQLLLSADDEALSRAQRAVEAAPALQRDFAPNLVNFVAYSVTQAERTGRTDLTWERGMLDEAASRLPLMPSLVAERLHVALVSGDAVEVGAVLDDARTWGAPYPYTAAYIERAEQLLATQ